ncbi:ribonuclease E inhibitor RraB [Asticcacaulis benevestitus]|uniref:Regulator of ribonuclease activity B domain-containing protein n=1 Tax=Asticcacaulis benevestitus DSM 16100 = ATCC BAA-896 TaxID=1121022 RepID=V4PEI6_9CAUL|nr:ribonuclease E inhibitor RraB [Asticcacaulis benevestitus]ESQ92352.1 hypothetical protein ABENE_08225 [Asticcacaulis benevestitus DSM 16100 = ATCC BAA-896]
MTIDFPNDENGDVLRRMQAAGDDLSQPRDIDFSLLFPDEGTAETFSAMMDAEGYEVELGPWEAQSDDDANTGKWDVTVTRHMVPDHAAITQFEKELSGIAMPFGGRNDGWGCFEVSAESEDLS